ncbi:gamma carbonic anhydrase family protein [Zavarzinella formosa]|uniref:gamma carbonic anhydrase family protein n=1 Tax=Zavarzinella formosa TaxID=360055 RepID=UPI00036E28CE|nr:gamma carbonic anhydrase family protein [Zavarzinella formosa]
MREVGGVFIAEGVVVTGDVVLEQGVNLWYGVIIRGDVAKITLRERVNIQDGSVVHCEFDVPQVIEPGVVVGHSAVLHGKSIGADTLIGIGARLLNRSEIGAECIIAAGAVVLEGAVIPPRSLVVGVPGKVVRRVTDEEVARTKMLSDRYQNMSRRYVAGSIPLPYGK